MSSSTGFRSVAASTSAATLRGTGREKGRRLVGRGGSRRRAVPICRLGVCNGLVDRLGAQPAPQIGDRCEHPPLQIVDVLEHRGDPLRLRDARLLRPCVFLIGPRARFPHDLVRALTGGLLDAGRLFARLADDFHGLALERGAQLLRRSAHRVLEAVAGHFLSFESRQDGPAST